MSDSTVNVDPDVGGLETSIQTPSPSAQTPSSPVDAKTVELLTRRLAQAEGEINALKSGKDKGIARVATDLAETRVKVDRILELSKSNLNSDQIARELAIDDLLQGQKTTPTTKVDATVLSDKQTVDPSVSSVELDAVIKLAGLDPGDKNVAEIYQKYPNDTLRQISELTTLGLKRLQSEQVQPNPAQLQTIGTGGKVPAAPTKDEIAAQLDKLMEHPSQNWKEIDRLTAELDKLQPIQK
jgi:hypothetical protein